MQQAGRPKLPSFNERAWTTPTCFARHSYWTSSFSPSSHHINFRYLSPRSLHFGSSAAQKRKVAVFVFPFTWMLLVVFQCNAVQWETLFRRRLRCTEGWKCLINGCWNSKSPEVLSDIKVTSWTLKTEYFEFINVRFILNIPSRLRMKQWSNLSVTTNNFCCCRRFSELYHMFRPTWAILRQYTVCEMLRRDLSISSQFPAYLHVTHQQCHILHLQNYATVKSEM
jgi:hypothetical protein